MKFPNSVHADGWADHIDTTPTRSPRFLSAPLRVHRPGARLLTGSARAEWEPSGGTSAASRIAPQAEGVMRPSLSGPRLPWTVVVVGCTALIGGLALWAADRPDVFATPPAIVGSVEPQTQVAAATPAPALPLERDTSLTEATVPVDPAPALEAAQVAPPVAAVKPAAAPRQQALAAVPALEPKSELVMRASPRGAEPALTPLPQPVALVAAAPAVEPPTVTPSTAPLTLPPMAAGPTDAAPVQPVAMLPQSAASAADDSGITAKVRGALAADATLASLPIAVSTDQGVVKLEGQASDAPTRERATVVASSAPGVKAVDNRLMLPPTTVSQATMPRGF